MKCVQQHLTQYVAKNQKCKKKVITDPAIRSLRHLYSLYSDNHYDALGLSYTSFKRIFNENNFSFPPERVRCKPIKTELKDEDRDTIVIQEILTNIENEDMYAEKQEVMDPTLHQSNLQNEALQPKVLVQVPDSSKFFANPSQVYEIQFIEIPISNTT